MSGIKTNKNSTYGLRKRKDKSHYPWFGLKKRNLMEYNPEDDIDDDNSKKTIKEENDVEGDDNDYKTIKEENDDGGTNGKETIKEEDNDDNNKKTIKEEYDDASFDSDNSEKVDNTFYSLSEKYAVKNNNISEYEKLRLKNIEENRKMMIAMGLIDAKKDFVDYVHQVAGNTVNKIKKKETRRKSTKTLIVTPPLRPRSQRIQNKLNGTPLVSESPLSTPEFQAEEYKQKIRNTEAVLSMTMEDHDEEGAWNDFLSNVRIHLDGESEAICIESTTSVAKEMRQLCLAALRTKIVNRRIQSLCIHPIESKLLVAAGSVEGCLGLWDVGSDLKPMQFYPHISPVNCITVRSADYNQLLTTSHDGTIRCADLQKSVFNLVYQTDEKKKISHLTWHCELSENTLLVAEGSGCVSIVDLRASDTCKPNMTIHCHPRSVRTVQVHPVKKNYFVTASGIGECKIFDIRNKRIETSSLIHKKGLTSAFFSPNGTKVLTTSNDDRLRIFDVTALDHPEEECKVLHDNHTGRWLSVFKAIWHPCSSDIFFIGSMQFPRRVQLYSATGALLKEVKSDDMTTITPVLSLHPALPIISGGDSSGRVYVFTTQSYIDKYDLKL